MSHTKTLDLGCGPNPKNPFNANELYGIDVRRLGPNIVSADLVIEPIPFESAMFDFVTAFDFLEHVPRLLYVPQRRNCFVELMNEIWRVLKVGGQFLSLTPAYPHAPAFRDPTHVNFITEETFPLYFDDKSRWAGMYGFTGAFEIVEQQWRGPHLQSLMRKVDVPQPAA
ncbi:SAM-dependent methyltransferase [Paraburkholderia bannensis]|uniref:SAM-dependent methyltransferase n=1 Tax=Paraburkholderia bannensis TaxID=765414 RepID=A0A7W9U3P4_9BURK|nr:MULTISPECIES: methyltransferase domain-containing protein [Paraburkholderia]MBB3260329.1 SAM-dependent methyltransferase [Paraburkholderia sp. WP4_3_2]MBB6105365.1 SAM-dependent methyltransferase [Paraburkholderia bannensis]